MEATIEQVASPHKDDLVRATYATPARQKTKAPAPRMQPIHLVVDVRVEESPQAIDTDVHQESASVELLLQTRTRDNWSAGTRVASAMWPSGRD